MATVGGTQSRGRSTFRGVRSLGTGRVHSSRPCEAAGNHTVLGRYRLCTSVLREIGSRGGSRSNWGEGRGHDDHNREPRPHFSGCAPR